MPVLPYACSMVGYRSPGNAQARAVIACALVLSGCTASSKPASVCCRDDASHNADAATADTGSAGTGGSVADAGDAGGTVGGVDAGGFGGSGGIGGSGGTGGGGSGSGGTSGFGGTGGTAGTGGGGTGGVGGFAGVGGASDAGGTGGTGGVGGTGVDSGSGGTGIDAGPPIVHCADVVPIDPARTLLGGGVFDCNGNAPCDDGITSPAIYCRATGPSDYAVGLGVFTQLRWYGNWNQLPTLQLAQDTCARVRVGATGCAITTRFTNEVKFAQIPNGNTGDDLVAVDVSAITTNGCSLVCP